jgi:hypothetical protein
MSIKDNKEFNQLIDNLIEGLENGTIEANPLKPRIEDIASEILIEETETELGENSIKINAVESEEFWGPKSIKITSKEGKITRYLNAAEAARDKDLNPTTVRTRCSKLYEDEEGNKWEYNG